MSNYLNEVFSNIRASIRFYISFCLILVICLVTSVLTISVNEDITLKTSAFSDKYADTFYYKIGDNFVDEYGKAFDNDASKYAKLMRLYHKLSNNDVFDYYVVYTNPIELKDFNGSDVFLKGYESGEYSSSILHLSNENGTEFTISIIKAVWIDSNGFDTFNITPLYGEVFSEDDYILSDYKQAVQPVILGYDYIGEYSIGDNIPADTFIFEGEGYLKVIGILEKNTIINCGNDSWLNLNRYIILPSKKIDSINLSKDNKYSYEFYTYIQCNGVAASKLTANEVQDFITSACDGAKVSPALYVKGATNQQSYKFNMSINELIDLIRPMLISGYILSTLILVSHIVLRINKEKKYYAILYAFRFNIYEIIVLVLTEFMITLTLSGMASFAILRLLSLIGGVYLSYTAFIIICVSYAVFILLVVGIIYYCQLKRMDLTKHIKNF